MFASRSTDITSWLPDIGCNPAVSDVLQNIVYTSILPYDSISDVIKERIIFYLFSAYGG